MNEPLDHAAEQRFLGVGVKVRHDQRAQAAHEPAVAANVAELLAPGDALVDARLARLRERLAGSPFWRARLRQAGMASSELRTLADLQALPPLSRDQLAAAWRDSYVSDGDPELHIATTSGSSGQALPVVRSGYDGVYMWTVIRFWLARLRIVLPPRPRLALFCTLPGGLEYSARAPLFFAGALHRVSALRGRVGERLRRVRPALLSSDPAGLHVLCGIADLPRPALILSSAQHLAPALRERATAALGAPIVDYYATTELGPIAWSCGARFHVLAPDVYVESVDGELVVSRLRDSVLPLLRYRTGDHGQVVDDTCACGHVGASIVGFAGRSPCWFVRPDGERVDAWTLSWLFKDMPLARFRLRQLAPSSFELTVADEPTLDLGLLAERLRRVLRRLGWAAASLDVLRGELAATAKPSPFVGPA